MLNEEQINELFEKIKQRHGIHDTRDFDFTKSGKDLEPEKLRDLSDEFDIDIDALRGYDSEKISLLMIESGSRLKLEDLPYDEQQSIEKWHSDIMNSENILKFLKSKKKKSNEPPQTPPDTGRRGQ